MPYRSARHTYGTAYCLNDNMLKEKNRQSKLQKCAFPAISAERKLPTSYVSTTSIRLLYNT